MRRTISTAFVSLKVVMQAPCGPEENRTGGFANGETGAKRDQLLRGQYLEKITTPGFPPSSSGSSITHSS